MRRMILVALACAALTACQNTPASPTTLGGFSSSVASSDAGTASTVAAAPALPAVDKSDRRGHGQEDQIEGFVEQLPPTTAPLTLVVAGVTVITDVNTKFYERGGAATFASLLLGQRVHVKGTMSDAGLLAAAIMIQNPNTGVGGISFTDVISGTITGTPPALTLTIGTYTVKTNANTIVKRKGDVQDLLALQVGMTVTVIGRLELDGTVTAKQIHIESDAVGGLFEMEGSVGNLSGTCPALSFKVAGYQIATNGSTTFVPNCAAVSNGSKVIVKGTVQSGGSILATRVEKK